MKEKGRKRQGADAPRTLTGFDRPQRIAIVLEVIHTLYDIDGYLGDYRSEDNMRALAKRIDAPVMVLCEAFDTPVQPTTADLREWCAFERGQAVP